MVKTNDTCIGKVVSDGVYVLNQETKFSSFGLTKDEFFVMGDMTSNEVKELKLEQLISGFGWLVQNGKNVVPKDGGLIAPRTAIGTDEKGNLMIFEADGQEYNRIGLTLFQTAAWFKKLGVLHAINLDGGGSSVAFYNGRIISYPTCTDTDKMCERTVTTITCVK